MLEPEVWLRGGETVTLGGTGLGTQRQRVVRREPEGRG